jgi:hypothetical protein
LDTIINENILNEVVGVAIQSVELINDYEINLNGGIFDSIRSNEELMNSLSVDHEIEEEDDIVFRDLAEACAELKLDLKTYFNEFKLIRIVKENGSEEYMTTLDIAPLWEWHEYADEMVCNWHENYLMLTATDYENQTGIMAIYDISKREWIFSDIEAFMRGMIYAEEINKFIGLYDIETEDYSEIGITIIDPTESFSDESITFEAIGKSNVENDDSDIQDFNHSQELGEDILEAPHISGTVIDEDTALLWNGKERCCYIRIDGKGFRYCFPS